MRPKCGRGAGLSNTPMPHYPDLDDTAAVVLAMDRARNSSLAPAGAYDESIARGLEWIEGMQSKNGGFGAFDADNTYYYLNYIPFADHGALLDPPTADVSARCVSMMAQLGQTRENNLFATPSIICLRSRKRTAVGSAAGASITSMVHGRCSRRSMPPGSIIPTGPSRRPYLVEADLERGRRLGRGLREL